MPKLQNPLLWNYFETKPDIKMAECKQCHKELSYKTTSGNLKHHLKIKHVSSYDELMENDSSSSLKKPRLTFPKSNNLLIWNYFEQDADGEGSRIAGCRLCRKKLSYKTTIGNLKQHLKKQHVSSYKEFVERGESAVVNLSEDDCLSESDDASEDLLKVTDVWSYFDTDSGRKRAQCTVCHLALNNEYEELKAHLKDNHPKLLLQLLQDKDSDAASNDGDEDENTYTEIVYLEQEPTENVTKHKEKSKSFLKSAKKRKRLRSRSSSEDIPLRKIQKKEEENDELGTFIKYITCLLKKLTPDVFSNVQIEIINAILKANSQANTRSMELSKERVNTSSSIITVDGIAPISSTMAGHNYTITLAPPKDGEAENGS